MPAASLDQPGSPALPSALPFAQRKRHEALHVATLDLQRDGRPVRLAGRLHRLRHIGGARDLAFARTQDHVARPQAALLRNAPGRYARDQGARSALPGAEREAERPRIALAARAAAGRIGPAIGGRTERHLLLTLLSFALAIW